MCEQNATAVVVEYRNIPGFPGYRVGDDGSVWSCLKRTTKERGSGRGPRFALGVDWKQMRPGIGNMGYRVATLCFAGKQYTRRVHSLVALCFIGPCPDGHEVCHIDGSRTNNASSNLRYGTRRANAADRDSHGTTARGERNGFSKLTEDQVREILRLGAAGMTQTERGKRFGVDHSLISLIDRRKAWVHVAEVPNG